MAASIRQLRLDLVYCLPFFFVGTATNMILSMQACPSSSLEHNANARLLAASTRINVALYTLLGTARFSNLPSNADTIVLLVERIV